MLAFIEIFRETVSSLERLFALSAGDHTLDILIDF